MGKHKRIFAIIFLLYLGVTISLNVITPDRAFSELENRRLEQAPMLTIDELSEGSFTSNYEKYIADQFALKDFWIGVKTGFERALGKKEYNGVYIGKNNYLLQDFKAPDEESFKAKVDAINSFGASIQNVNQYFMLVPNSVEILSNKLPPYVQVESEKEWIKRIKSSLNKQIKFVDVYNTLADHKENYLYYKTDHHWTTTGAFYAYQKLMAATGETPHDQSYFNIKKVTDNFYGSLFSQSGLKHVEPDSIKLYLPKQQEMYKVEYFDEEGINKVTKSLYNNANLKKKDKYALFLDGNYPLIKISTNNASMKKLLVVKDSYGNCLIPFLTGHYSQIFVVDLRYYYDNLSEIIKNNGINDMLTLYNVNTFFADSSVEGIADYVGVEDTAEEKPANPAVINYREYFKEDVFMGDSITEAISYLGLLAPQNVCGKVGINIDEALAQVNSINLQNPRNIYLLYGVNDMDDRTAVAWFVEQYRLLVRSVQQKYPNAHIYVQSVLPVNTAVEQRKPHTNNQYINKCNLALMKMASEERVGFINLATLINEKNRNLYEADGFHFKAPFYDLWFNYLINILEVSK